MNHHRTIVATLVATLGLFLAACSSASTPPVSAPVTPTTTTAPSPALSVVPPTLQSVIATFVAIIPPQWMAPGWTWTVVPVLPVPYQADSGLTESYCNCSQFSASVLTPAISTPGGLQLIETIVDHEAMNAFLMKYVSPINTWVAVPGWPSVFQAGAPIAPGFSVVDEASRCLTQYVLRFDPPAHGVEEVDSIECPAPLG